MKNILRLSRHLLLIAAIAAIAAPPAFGLPPNEVDIYYYDNSWTVVVGEHDLFCDGSRYDDGGTSVKRLVVVTNCDTSEQTQQCEYYNGSQWIPGPCGQ